MVDALEIVTGIKFKWVDVRARFRVACMGVVKISCLLKEQPSYYQPQGDILETHKCDE